MKNRRMIIGVGAVAILILVVIGYFVLFSKKDTSEESFIKEEVATEEIVNLLSAEEIGLSLTATPDNKKVIIEIIQTEDIVSLDYELSYVSKGDIPRGIIGHIENETPGKIIQQEIVLGTCSDVCHYDEDVSDINLVVRITKTNNMIYSVERSL